MWRIRRKRSCRGTNLAFSNFHFSPSKEKKISSSWQIARQIGNLFLGACIRGVSP
jgi:hypothetical protein